MKYFTLDPKIEYIKIFGLQRSGTNYLSYLINENFNDVHALVNLGGWKHGFYAVPWILGQEAHVLGIIKNPYAWLVSIYNYWGRDRVRNVGPDIRGVKFENFIKNRVIFEKQKDIPYVYRSANPIQHWNNMNFHWSSIRLNEKKLCIVKYETLLCNLETTVYDIKNALSLELKNESIITSDKKFIPSGEQIKTNNESFDKEYYLNDSFLSYYTPELIEFVNKELDLDVMVHYKYNLVSPEELKEVKC